MSPKPKEKQGESKVVAGTMSASGRGIIGGKGAVAKLVEEAMASAVQHCFDKKITDPNVIRAAQLEARRIVLEKVNELVAKASAEASKPDANA